MHTRSTGIVGKDTILVISNLQQGGAERQLCILANGLARRGTRVRIVVYSVRCDEKDLFYKTMLDDAVELTIVRARGRLRRVLGVVRELVNRKAHAVIAYLPFPSLISEVTRMLGRRFMLVVSERSWNPGKRFELVRYGFHRVADAVVSNSYAQRDRIRSVNSVVGEKTVVIRNAIDFEVFYPARSARVAHRRKLRILVLARVVEEKNPIGLLSALYEVRKKFELDVRVDWYGALSSVGWRLLAPNRRAYGDRLAARIPALGMQEMFLLHAPVADVVSLYHDCDVACLPSFAEGCSNFICEAMACGVPVLASDVGDNGRLVKDGHNGFLFDPGSVAQIVAAITEFADLPVRLRKRMAVASRERAEAMLSPDAYIERYERLFQDLGCGGMR